MKSYVLLVVALTFTFGAAHAQTDASSVLRDPEMRQQILHAIVGDHELMMGLIGEVKKSDHAKMMIEHLLSVAAEPTDSEDHANANGKVDTRSALSPYAGKETRKIKALSTEDIKGYLDGEGRGAAMAAELNHYPGPRHALAVESALELSSNQTKAIKDIYDAMHAQAVELGREIVRKEEQLDRLFAGGQIDEPRLKSSVTEIARLQGDLRATHLRAHLATKKVLSAEQVKKYDELRGYGAPGADHPADMH